MTRDEIIKEKELVKEDRDQNKKVTLNINGNEKWINILYDLNQPRNNALGVITLTHEYDSQPTYHL